MKADKNEVRTFAKRYGLDNPMLRGAKCLFGLFTENDFRFLLEDDAAAIRSDWEAVGKDIAQATK